MLWPIIDRIFASDRVVSNFNALAGGDSLRISEWTLALQKLEWFCYLTLKTARSYLHSSEENIGTCLKDRQTDGQNHSGYYSGLHCEQCGRAVTIVNTNRNTLAKSIADTNTNTASETYFQYWYQYFCANTFYCLLRSAMFIFLAVIHQ